MLKNRSTFSNPNIVNKYAKVTKLQKPEKIIFDKMKNELHSMRMLDVGVGTGRTTHHFGKKVKDYIGIDYSETMIDLCKENFINDKDNICFQVGDVVEMKGFDDNSFDFILVSFNGMDYVSNEDRKKAINEIYRLLKPNGYFCFSTHNIFSIKDLFKFRNQFSLNPKLFLKNIRRWFKLISKHAESKNILTNKEYVIFNDGSLNFSLETYYIDPSFQKYELKKLFSSPEIFNLNGENISNTKDFRNVSDPWLYFLCKANK